MAVESYRQGRQTSLFFPLPQGQFWAQIFPERKFGAQTCPEIQGIYAIFCFQRVVTNAYALPWILWPGIGVRFASPLIVHCLFFVPRGALACGGLFSKIN